MEKFNYDNEVKKVDEILEAYDCDVCGLYKLDICEGYSDCESRTVLNCDMFGMAYDTMDNADKFNGIKLAVHLIGYYSNIEQISSDYNKDEEVL